jgi:hypothetical protein
MVSLVADGEMDQHQFSHNAHNMFARFAALTVAILLAACSVPTPTDIVYSTVFARPSVAYQSGDNIGVDYNEGGILDATNRREPVTLIEQYCKGQFRIVQRRDGHIEAALARIKEAS